MMGILERPSTPDVLGLRTSLKKRKIEIDATQIRASNSCSPKFSTKEVFKQQFANLKYGSVETRTEFCTLPNRRTSDDYTQVFLSHARIYVFAERYDIKVLKMLALKKLHEALVVYRLFPERIGDITALLKYVYANTGLLEGSIENMKEMLTHYMACEMETILPTKEFKDLLKEDGTLLDDFLQVVGKRIGG